MTLLGDWTFSWELSKRLFGGVRLQKLQGRLNDGPLAFNSGGAVASNA